MSTKKRRAAIAAAVAGTAGTAAGVAASYYGLDPVESTRFGTIVGGAVGNLLYQALRLAPDEDAFAPRTVAPRTAESDISNAPETGLDTGVADRTATARARGRKLSRHRKLERAARRRIERRRREGRKEYGHGTS